MAKKVKDAKKKPKKKQQKNTKQVQRQNKTPIQSTQQNVMIKDIMNNGIVITKETDGSILGSTDITRFVKVIEVKPAPFFKKTIEERNRIGQQFEASLKSAPNNLHIKIMTVPADLSVQVAKAQENIKEEFVENCRQMGEEYIEHLHETEEYGLTHRYFISYEYEPTNKSLTGEEKLQDINYQMARYKNLLSNGLGRCGNETVYPEDGESEKTQVERMLYTFFNRNKPTKSDFNARYTSLYQKYSEKDPSNPNPYIPPSDVVAPNKISYLDRKFMVVNDMYYEFLYIPANGYNNYAVDGWLQLFTTLESGIDVDVFLQREDRQKKIRELRRTVGHAIVDINDSNGVSSGGELAQRKYQSGQYLLSSLQGGYDFYNAETIITVCGKTPKEVETKADLVKSIGRENDIIIKEVIYQQEDAFKSVAITGKISPNLSKKLGRNMTTSGASSFYSFTSAELIHPDGLYIADDMESGSPVIPDLFNKDQFVNPHLFVCGETGAGKTASIMQIAIRARLKHIPVFVLAPEKQSEFQRLCNELGGQFVNIAPSGENSTGYRINIFEIFPKVEREKQEVRGLDGDEFKDLEEDDNQIAEKISVLNDFFNIFLKGNVSQKQADIINEALIKTYAKKGILIEDENSLWLDKKNKIFKEMPVMSDFVDTLLYDFKDTELEKEASFLGYSIRPLTRGNGSFFNGQTNIDANNEFFVFGLENVGETYTGLAMYMVMEYVWSKVKSIKGHKVLMIDEWWKMANNRLAAERTMKIAKLARSLGGSLIIATQQMTDILNTDEGGKLGKDVLNNCASKIIMHLQKDDLKAVSNIIHLTKAEMDSIGKYGAGQGLFVNNDLRISLQFNPTETEKLFTFNDPDTLAIYEQFVKQRNEILDEQKKLSNPDSLSDLFSSHKKQEVKVESQPQNSDEDIDSLNDLFGETSSNR